VTHLFGTCPHDSMSDPEKWVALMQYVIDSCGVQLEYERHTDFHQFEENFGRFDLVYAMPLHALQLATRDGFTPLAKFDAVFDEAIIFSSNELSSPHVSQFADHRVAFADDTPSYAAFLISARREGWPAIGVPVVKTNYPDVLMAVVQGDADFGIILKSSWDGMSALKGRVTPVAVTKTRELAHLFLVSPQLRDRGSAITDALVALETGEEGRAILRRLGCPRIVPFSQLELQQMRDSIAMCHFAE